ncbi:MAG: efflux RND transporter permease subunit [bacterium]
MDPDLLQHHGLSLAQVFNAVRQANQDVGAGTLEINKVEYVIRGVGLIRTPEDLADVVIVAPDHVPVTVGQVARVVAGPEPRRGALDKAGTEAVGGVVTVRYGENPLAVIDQVHARIAEIAPSLPRRTLADGRVSQVQITVLFYDRTDLIHDPRHPQHRPHRRDPHHHRGGRPGVGTADFLHDFALCLAVLLAFLGMRVTGVDANPMSLAGIAIKHRHHGRHGHHRRRRLSRGGWRRPRTSSVNWGVEGGGGRGGHDGGGDHDQASCRSSRR